MSRPVGFGNGCGPPGICTPFWVYQSLPRSSLTERIALADLVWSASGLPTVTTASDVPDDPFWLVWILLPIPTKSPFWVHTYRVRPLPTFTTANRGLGIELGIYDRATSIRHQVAGWHRVIRVDNVENRWEPSEVAVRWWSASKRKSFRNQVGRLVFLHPWW